MLQASTTRCQTCPVLLSEGLVSLLTGSEPQELIFLACRYLSTNQCRINAFISEWHFVLLIVVDVARVLDYAQEYRDGIARQLRARKASKFRKVKTFPCLRSNLKGCATSATFVVGNEDTVDVGFLDTGESTQNLGNFRS